MIQFENTEVFNMLNAIRGMRNSWESWGKSDSYEEIREYYNDNLPVFYLGEEDRKLAMKLAKAGPEHGKFLRQILISVDITAPLKWWDEANTYHFFETNSTSAMHTLGKEYITSDAFSFEDLDDDVLDAYMDLLNVTRKRWENAGKKKPSREWRQMVMLMAAGFNYRRTFTSNYSQLRTMYFQRKNHRLSEWHEFCKWVDGLPYSELITLEEK